MHPSVTEEEHMRATLVVVTAALGAAAATCMGPDPATEATVSSASQGATMTGTGATGGSTPETDMQGTGRAWRPPTPSRAVAPPPVPTVPPPATAPAVEEPPPTAPAVEEPPMRDGGVRREDPESNGRP